MLAGPDDTNNDQTVLFRSFGFSRLRCMLSGIFIFMSDVEYRVSEGTGELFLYYLLKDGIYPD